MEKIGQVILDDTLYPGKDLYTDGAIEDEMLSRSRGFYKACENVKTGCRWDEYRRKYRYVERAGIMCMNSRNLCNRP